MNLLKSLILTIITGVILCGCKKGDNDPFLSFLSRKARITGTWSLKEGSLTIISGDTTCYTYTDSLQTLTYGSYSGTTAYSKKITINKDGSCRVDVNDDSDLSVEEGVWFFGGKSKDMEIKDKESVIFRIFSEKYTSGGITSTATYEGTSCPIYTLLLDKLGNKEIIFKYDGSSTSSSTTTVTGTMTYVQ